jgi:hypothetical protein
VGNFKLAREDRLRLGALEQAQGGADDLAGTSVAARGGEPRDEVTEFACEGDVEAVVGRHATLLVRCHKGVTFGNPF